MPCRFLVESQAQSNTAVSGAAWLQVSFEGPAHQNRPHGGSLQHCAATRSKTLEEVLNRVFLSRQNEFGAEVLFQPQESLNQVGMLGTLKSCRDQRARLDLRNFACAVGSVFSLCRHWVGEVRNTCYTAQKAGASSAG